MKRRSANHGQRGMTLVELMVAMAIGLLIVLAATAALVVARRGYSTVDAASQLRDNARFSADLINRILVQSGFEDLTYAISTRKLEDGTATNPVPNITGFNNALIAATTPLTTKGAAGLNGSDVLVVRYQAGETYPGSGLTDGTMIDCMGKAASDAPANRDDRLASIFHVATSNGEPSLMCSTVNSAGLVSTLPMVQGVENFQVLYGVDGVVAGTAPAATLAVAANPDRYLRADQMIVTGNDVGTNANWRRVRSVRIGMVLRSADNTAQEKGVQTVYPLGRAPSSGGSDGSALSAAADTGTVFNTASDARLRQTVTFTVHLRNAQDLSNPIAQP